MKNEAQMMFQKIMSCSGAWRVKESLRIKEITTWPDSCGQTSVLSALLELTWGKGDIGCERVSAGNERMVIVAWSTLVWALHFPNAEGIMFKGTDF